MARYPKLDLPPIPDDLDVRLQSASELERIHDDSEFASSFYPVAHKAITFMAQKNLEHPELVVATDLGIGVFEALGHEVDPERVYEAEIEKVLIASTAQLYAGRIAGTDVYLAAMEQARVRMEEDTPHLTEVLTEIVGRYTHHDPVVTRFALQGAAAIRGLQIFIDKRLEAAA